MCQELFEIFNLVEIKTSIDIFGSEKFKVTFDFKYTFGMLILCYF